MTTDLGLKLFVLEYEDADGYGIERAVLAEHVWDAMYDTLPEHVVEVTVQEAELVGEKVTYQKLWKEYKS